MSVKRPEGNISFRRVFLFGSHENLCQFRVGIQNDCLLIAIQAGFQGVQGQGEFVEVNRAGFGKLC